MSLLLLLKLNQDTPTVLGMKKDYWLAMRTNFGLRIKGTDVFGLKILYGLPDALDLIMGRDSWSVMLMYPMHTFLLPSGRYLNADVMNASIDVFLQETRDG